MSSDYSFVNSMPPENLNETVLTERYFQAIDNMTSVFAIRPDDTVLFLSDPLIDPRVFHAVAGIARSRGVRPELYSSSNWNSGIFPEELKPVYEKASLVVSTWFASIGDPYCLKVRRDTGQRTVKMTYFRNIDVLKTVSRPSLWGKSRALRAGSIRNRRTSRSESPIPGAPTGRPISRRKCARTC